MSKIKIMEAFNELLQESNKGELDSLVSSINSLLPKDKQITVNYRYGKSVVEKADSSVTYSTLGSKGETKTFLAGMLKALELNKG